MRTLPVYLVESYIDGTPAAGTVKLCLGEIWDEFRYHFPYAFLNFDGFLAYVKREGGAAFSMGERPEVDVVMTVAHVDFE